MNLQPVREAIKKCRSGSHRGRLLMSFMNRVDKPKVLLPCVTTQTHVAELGEGQRRSTSFIPATPRLVYLGKRRSDTEA